MTSRAYLIHQPVPRPDKISCPLSGRIFLTYSYISLVMEIQQPFLFSISEIQEVTKNSEIFSGLLVSLRMNSNFNLPPGFTGSSPKCRCLWCRQELDWGIYGEIWIPSLSNNSLNPKEFYWYQWGYPLNILLSNMKKGKKLIEQEDSFGRSSNSSFWVTLLMATEVLAKIIKMVFIW